MGKPLRLPRRRPPRRWGQSRDPEGPLANDPPMQDKQTEMLVTPRCSPVALGGEGSSQEDRTSYHETRADKLSASGMRRTIPGKRNPKAHGTFGTFEVCRFAQEIRRQIQFESPCHAARQKGAMVSEQVPGKPMRRSRSEAEDQRIRFATRCGRGGPRQAGSKGPRHHHVLQNLSTEP